MSTLTVLLSEQSRLRFGRLGLRVQPVMEGSNGTVCVRWFGGVDKNTSMKNYDSMRKQKRIKSRDIMPTKQKTYNKNEYENK
jgi:hypothetical protein